MSISAVDCTPIKPQVSFGNAESSSTPRQTKSFAEDKANYDSLVMASSDLQESIPEQKSFLGTVASVAVAAAVMYGGGKLVGSKINEIAPKFAPALVDGLRNGANTIRNKAAELSQKDGKVASAVGKGIAKAEKFARNVYKNHIQKGGSPADAMKNLAGSAGLIFGTGRVVTVDANVDPTTGEKGDNIADIKQKGVNAYGNALKGLDAISNIITAVS